MFLQGCGAESAPVLLLTSTRVPSSERQSSSWTLHRFPGFGLHRRASAAPPDDSNYCKHVITQDLLFIRTCFTGSRQWGENDWLAVAPPRILSAAAKCSSVCVSSGSLLLYLQQVAGGVLAAEDWGRRQWHREQALESPAKRTGQRKRQILKFWAAFLAASLLRPNPESALWQMHHLKLQGC